ncbi:MAG: lysoplasmalogenase [Paracoccaceae bacterium]
MTTLALALFALAAVAALIYLLRFAAAGPSAGKSVSKTLAVAALAPVAAVLGAPGALVAGLLLGAAGDFALSRPGDRAFLAGMAAFAAGHLAYVLAFAGLGAGWPGLWLALPVLALVASTEIWLAPHAGALRLPVRGYALVIGAMGLAALGLPAGQGLLRWGALAFILSDLILAVETFRLRDGTARRAAKRALWVFYWGGQAAIALGAAWPWGD